MLTIKQQCKRIMLTQKNYKTGNNQNRDGILINRYIHLLNEATNFKYFDSMPGGIKLNDLKKDLLT